MNWPNRSGATDRIRIKSSGSKANPQVGDVLTIVLGKNIEATDYSFQINRIDGGGLATLSTGSMTYTMQAADIPSVGTTKWPIVARAQGLVLASDPFYSQNPPTVPAAPTMGTATAGNATVSVPWTSGSNGGSAVTSRDIQWFDASGNLLGFKANVANPAVLTAADGIVNNQQYKFKVRENNVIGTGPYAAAFSNTVTPSYVDLKPFGNRSRLPTAIQSMATLINRIDWCLLGRAVNGSPYGFRIAWSATGFGASNNQVFMTQLLNVSGISLAYNSTPDITTATFVQLKIAGANSINIDPATNTKGFVCDEAIAQGLIPAGSYIWASIAYEGASGASAPVSGSFSPSSNLEGSMTSASTPQTSLLLSGARTATGINGAAGWIPSMVSCRGLPDKASVANGDSLMHGQNENGFTQSTDGLFGWYSRGQAGGGTVTHSMNLAIPGSSIGAWVDNNQSTVSNMLALFDDMVAAGLKWDCWDTNHATNGFGTGGTSFAGMQSKFITWYDTMIAPRFVPSGVKTRYFPVLCKVSSSTDGGLTLAGMTATFPEGSAQMQFRDWITSTLGGGRLTGYLDINPSWCASGDRTKPMVGAYSGTVATGFDYAANAATIRITPVPPTDIALDLFPTGGGANFAGAGVGRAINRLVDNGDGTATVTINGSGWTYAAPAGTAIIELTLVDGTHGCAKPHKAGGVLFSASKMAIFS